MTSPKLKPTKPPAPAPTADNYCFVCGRDNPQGFKIQVRYSEADLAAEPNSPSPGIPGLGRSDPRRHPLHLLDELMAHAVWRFAGPGLTLSMEVRFHAPLKPDEPIRVRGVMHPANGSRRQTEGEIIRLADGQRIASGKSRFLLLGNDTIKD